MPDALISSIDNRSIDPVIIAELQSLSIQIINQKFRSVDGWSYHNSDHTLQVVNDLTRITLRLNHREIQLLQIAASFHDIDQTSQNPELNSFLICEEHIAGKGFNCSDIDTIKDSILCTQALPNQRTVLDWPNRSELGDFLRDSDMALMGKPFPEFIRMTCLLFSEFQYTQRVPVNTFNDFLFRQIPLLENFRFYTEEAQLAFPHRQDNIQSLYQFLKI